VTDIYREIAPPPELSSQVEAFWIREGGEKTDAHRVLPDGCIDLLFVDRQSGGQRLHSLFVVGPMTRFIDVKRKPGDSYVGVRFRPGAAPAVLGIAASEIVDASPTLENLWGSRARSLLDRLAEQGSAQERVDILRGALARPGARGPELDPRVAAAVRLLRHSSSEIRIESLSAAVGVSPRQLRRLFHESVGLSPKRLHRILRLRSVLDTARESSRRESRDWSAISLDAGFYDQAYFVNDFRSWTGLSPTRYLAAR
jgi:AraC-like DNA-binding protein